MKTRMQGALSLLCFLFALTYAGGAIAQSNRPPSGESKSDLLRRDLGEKGQIVIESLDLYDTDIESVVRLLARVAGINIITGAISGSISVYLENVTVQDALEAILASQGYSFIYDGNIVRVVDAAKVGEDRVETITETFILNYLPADKVAETLRNVFQGGQYGASYSRIEANVEANAIIAVDIPRRMEDIRRMIEALDQRYEQVEIEGRFVEITYKQEQDWGIDWKYFQDPANQVDVNLAPQQIDVPSANGQFKFAIIRGNHNLSGFLQMLETDNDIKVLASPKTLAVENKEAVIELTNEIPFVEANVSQGVITESVQFQETGIRLIVTPTVAQENDGTYITMKLELEQRIAGPNIVLQNSVAFPVDSRRAETTLVAPDESTIIIGGLKSNDQTYTYEKVPFFGSIPVLGVPFRRRTKKEGQTELILFVTPRVIYDVPPLDEKEMRRHDELDEVIDGLNTQSDWRERAEAPIDMIDKGILYSAEIVNKDSYDRVENLKKKIERVKPYKIKKPKGHRRLRIVGRGSEVHEEYEEVPDETVQAASSEEVLQATREVRDFSIVEEKAEPGKGAPSGASWFHRDQEQSVQPQPAGPPPVVIPPPPPPSSTQEPESKSKEAKPSWLRRGSDRRRSDAGDIESPLPEMSTESTSSDEVMASADSNRIEIEEVLPSEPEPSGEHRSAGAVEKERRAEKTLVEGRQTPGKEENPEDFLPPVEDPFMEEGTFVSLNLEDFSNPWAPVEVRKDTVPSEKGYEESPELPNPEAVSRPVEAEKEGKQPPPEEPPVLEADHPVVRIEPISMDGTKLTPVPEEPKPQIVGAPIEAEKARLSEKIREYNRRDETDKPLVESPAPDGSRSEEEKAEVESPPVIKTVSQAPDSAKKEIRPEAGPKPHTAETLKRKPPEPLVVVVSEIENDGSSAPPTEESKKDTSGEEPSRKQEVASNIETPPVSEPLRPVVTLVTVPGETEPMPEGSSPKTGGVGQSGGEVDLRKDVPRVVLKTTSPEESVEARGTDTVGKVEQNSKEPEVVDLRGLKPTPGRSESPNFRKYLSPEILAAMEELDKIEGQSSDPPWISSPIEVLDVPTRPVLDPWEPVSIPPSATVPVGSVDRSGAVVAQGAGNIEVTSLRETSSPRPKKIWWKRLLGK